MSVELISMLTARAPFQGARSPAPLYYSRPSCCSPATTHWRRRGTILRTGMPTGMAI